MLSIDQIIRSRRKTLAVGLTPEGRVLVRAPLRATHAQINAFVEQHSAWIRTHQEAIRSRVGQYVPKTYQPGEQFLFLGKNYPLKLGEQTRPALQFTDGFILADIAQPKAEQHFIAWYRAQARLIFTRQVILYAERYNFRYNKIHISSARTRWGSCSCSGTISFTWRLVMAPLDVIDYVVVHELVHTMEHNHQTRFWKKVEAILPDYVARQNWLKTNGSLLPCDFS